MPGRCWPLVALLVASILPTVYARQPAPQDPPDRLAAAVASAAGTAERGSPPAHLTFANRPIVTLRATVMSRHPRPEPRMRPNCCVACLTRTRPRAPASTPIPTGPSFASATSPVFVIFTGGLDPLEGEDVVSTAQAAADRLQVAFDEAIESHSPRRLVRAGAISFAATLLYALGIWAIVTRRTPRRDVRHPAGGAAAPPPLRRRRAGRRDGRAHQRAPALHGGVVGARRRADVRLADDRHAALPLHAAMGRVAAQRAVFDGRLSGRGR